MILLCKFVYIQQKIFSLSKLPTVGEAVKLNAKKRIILIEGRFLFLKNYVLPASKIKETNQGKGIVLSSGIPLERNL